MSNFFCFDLIYEITRPVSTTGNKSDRISEKEIPTDVGQEFARRHSMTFLETSAKDADNVEKLFTEIATKLTQEAMKTGVQHAHANGTNLDANFNMGGSSPVSVLPNCCRPG